MDVFGRKETVLSLVERGGGVRSFHVPNVTAKTLRRIIVQTAHRASHLMTDAARETVRNGQREAFGGGQRQGSAKIRLEGSLSAVFRSSADTDCSHIPMMASFDMPFACATASNVAVPAALRM